MILLILTSHREDCFTLCLDCLERHTDLALFKRIYVMANALEPSHFECARAFAARHSNVTIVGFGPRGLPATMEAQTILLQDHMDSIVVKLDEDVFVTAGWLQGLVQAYTRNSASGCVFVSSLVPNNQMGRTLLENTFTKDYPEFADSPTLSARPISENSAYAIWIWEQFLQGHMQYTRQGLLHRLTPQRVTRYININCILVDPRMLGCALPFGIIPGTNPPEVVTDEYKINMVLLDSQIPFYGLVTPYSVAHHYSFGPQQAMVDAHIPLIAIREKLLGSPS